VSLLDTITTVAAAIELFGALLFAVAFVQGPVNAEHRVAAVLCLAAGVHAAGLLVLSRAPAHGAAMAAAAFASLGLVAAAPTAAHFALVYRGTDTPRGTIASLYVVAAGCALLDVFAVPHTTELLATRCACVVASLSTIVIVARAYLSGRREALALVMGATVLLATSVHDLSVTIGLLTTGYLVDAGLAALIAGIVSTRSTRFTSVERELDRRTKELRTRTHELRRSDEDLRAAQEELVKREQLAVVGELAAVIAHEVRNPLAIIANAVAGLRRQGTSREDHETLLSILDEETSRLNRLVTDLLRYARPVNVQRSDFSLADVLDRALSLVSKDRKSIKTELKVDGHDGRIWGDPNLLRQVFDNLVVNAVQAMTAGGALTVHVRAATEDGVPGVAVDIIDTGEGMDTQIRSRARDPFFTTRPSGTGLGLAIVDRIVDAHAGHLAIDSRTGEGTTVTVFLPQGAPSEHASPRSRSANVPPEVPGAAGSAS
jgi:signal transduction histidine kinase